MGIFNTIIHEIIRNCNRCSKILIFGTFVSSFIDAVWPAEVHAGGLRDDSLAQLVRRLRLKIEPDPSNPTRILTLPGRGYHFTG